MSSEYKAIIEPKFQWSTWALPKGKDGKFDHQIAMTGDDLRDFVDGELFPYLKKFKVSAEKGAYRLFGYVDDGQENAATSNIPFKVN